MTKRKRMFSIDFTVTTSTCDAQGRLTLFSALQMMQDCSEMWLDSEPVVKHYFRQNAMAQLLASRQVEVVRVPRFKERLTVSTSVYEVKPMFGFRNTFITDEDGKPCYKTWSMGAFVDMHTGRLTRADGQVLQSVTLDQRQPMDYRERRITLPHDGGTTYPGTTVQKADIDYNRHMNNAHYVRHALELLPDDFEVRHLRVEYRIAAKRGDVLVPVMYGLEPGTYIIALLLGGQVATIMEFKS